ncbi:Hypothetical predicted protein [Podarcis lilfordi]|uniref:Uncharacterized protein n=1 Tax=Podarcis lilfordi TaxID=74358 RepID=A0AA35PP73_9SAUR|nr:Hypothetical predicted protein [Podarcis lilfordi]
MPLLPPANKPRQEEKSIKLLCIQLQKCEQKDVYRDCNQTASRWGSWEPLPTLLIIPTCFLHSPPSPPALFTHRREAEAYKMAPSAKPAFISCSSTLILAPKEGNQLLRCGGPASPAPSLVPVSPRHFPSLPKCHSPSGV